MEQQCLFVTQNHQHFLLRKYWVSQCSHVVSNLRLLCVSLCLKYVNYFMILYILFRTATRDLGQVYFAITKVVQWTSLGLALGLDYSTLQRIEREKMGRIEECKMEMLSAWLQQKDDVVEKALPTWSSLGTALRKIGENKVANKLSKY